MHKVIVNTNEVGTVIAIGNVSHNSIVHRHTVNLDDVPDDIGDNLEAYRYIGGMFEKVTVINEVEERNWQRIELKKVSEAISEYQNDIAIDERYSELRAGTYTEADYFSLLGDRKLLIEYTQQSDFPGCARPTLSGIAN